MSEGHDTPSGPPRTEFDPSYEGPSVNVPASAGSGGGITPMTTTSTVDPGDNVGIDVNQDTTTGVAADQAKQVGRDALGSGKQVAGVAADQAKTVASEAGAQAKNLWVETRAQLNDQASTQQNNLAARLRSIVDELDQMTSGTKDPAQDGVASAVISQVSERARAASAWLEGHEPADLLAATSRFARQRPGLFLALAAAGGVLAGRLTRGLTADASPETSAGGRTGYPTSLEANRQTGSQATGSAGSTAPVTTTAASGPYTTATPEPASAEDAGSPSVPGGAVRYDDDLNDLGQPGFEGGTGSGRDLR